MSQNNMSENPNNPNIEVSEVSGQTVVVGTQINMSPPHIRERLELVPPFTAPKPPPQFVQRPKECERLVALLLEKGTVAITTALSGGGGFGKTTLAQAICHDERVKAAFPDGILWVTVGQMPNLVELVNNQIRLLVSEATSFTDLNAAQAYLRVLLSGRRVLLVLDDVWQQSHVYPFVQDGSTCAHLITTRRQDVAVRMGARTVDVNQMSTSQATELLSRWLVRGNEQPLRELAKYLGEWPLLLSLAAAQLREFVELDLLPLDMAIAELWEALEHEGFTAFDRTDEDARNQAISISLNLSTRRLGEWQRRFMELALFAEDIDIPFVTIERLWARTAGLTKRQSKKALRAIQRLSLFTRYDPTNKTVRLHDVIGAYLAQQQKEYLPTLHTQLLSAHRPYMPNPESLSAESPTWADLPHDEPYLWNHLAYHLIEAGLSDELVATVKELRYLAVKSFLRSAYAAEVDLLVAEKHAPLDQALRLLRRAFVNTAHLLDQCKRLNHLAATLHSRLQHLDSLASITALLSKSLPRAYLTAWHPLPDLPSPAPIRTLIGHTAPVRRCAISADRQLIVSASDDKTLKVWDGESGQERFT